MDRRTERRIEAFKLAAAQHPNADVAFLAAEADIIYQWLIRPTLFEQRMAGRTP